MMAVGKNSLLIYVLSQLLLATLYSIPTDKDGGSLYSLLFDVLLNSWINTSFASLLWSQIWAWLVFVPLAWFLDIKKWYLKI